MKKIFLFILTAALASSCASDNGESTKDQYDRSAMLHNWADNIILPAFQDYNTKITALKTAVGAFNAAPTTTALTDVRSKWLSAYKSYQHIAMFAVGKADEIQFTKYCNTYPANATLINSKIANGDVNIEGPANDVAQGFPALDYLLFGLADTPEATVAFYTDNANADGYKNYLEAVAEKLAALCATVYNEWQGNFKAEYVSKTDNTAPGSVNRTVNAFIYYYEKELRTAKVAIPAGRFSTTPLPDKVEGYYSRIYSKELLSESLTACHNFFRGRHYGTDASGSSLKSYLEFAEVGNDVVLSTAMDNQFTVAANAIDALTPNLYEQVITDNNKMLTAFDALQRNVAYMKTDMVSLMNIAIDYVDSDGD